MIWFFSIGLQNLIEKIRKAETKSAKPQYYKKRKEIQQTHAEKMRDLFNADEIDEQDHKRYLIMDINDDSSLPRCESGLRSRKW